LLALGESTGISDTAQLVIFVLGADKRFSYYEEMAALIPLKAPQKPVIYWRV